jgi:hypothetical protein
MPYFDTAVVATGLILLGQGLELKASSQTYFAHPGRMPACCWPMDSI